MVKKPATKKASARKASGKAAGADLPRQVIDTAFL